jgi:ubiquinol-cytochrome c reductase cytochrome c subunit
MRGCVVIAAWVFSTRVMLALLSLATSEGATLYAIHCSACHGNIGQGSNVAPALIGKPAVDVHFMLDTGRMPAAIPDVNDVHREPAFTYRQIDEITNYVMALSANFGLHPDMRLPLLGPADVVRGRRLFIANCAPCHGIVAEGASVGGDDVAPSLMNATVFQVAEAIRTGPGIMPRFDARLLSDQDVDDIARYVNDLQASQGDRMMDPGGISLAHTGPVAEGVIAWIFGIGLLVLFVRLIGTTR